METPERKDWEESRASAVVSLKQALMVVEIAKSHLKVCDDAMAKLPVEEKKE